MPEVEPPDAARAGRRARVPAREPATVHRTALDAAPLRRPAVLGLRAAATSAAGSGCSSERPLDALAIAVCADAWFPAPWPRLDELAPAPTIDLTIHFRAPLPLADSLLSGRFETGLVRDGFFDEDGELWAPDGTLVAQSRQLGLLLGRRPRRPPAKTERAGSSRPGPLSAIRRYPRAYSSRLTITCLTSV